MLTPRENDNLGCWAEFVADEANKLDHKCQKRVKKLKNTKNHFKSDEELYKEIKENVIVLKQKHIFEIKQKWTEVENKVKDIASPKAFQTKFKLFDSVISNEIRVAEREGLNFRR